ncbi:hypothetical protein B0H14DRAFT_3528229 [Mycena olivaceomarginata]|nr:hypothetical protein B0H14DRAFT_3528229 [Mycena olivaceomarginata]
MPCTPTVEIMARRASLFIGLLAQAAISTTAPPPPNAARLPTSWVKSFDALGLGLPDTLVTDILSIDFEARNPLFFELALDRVSSTVGINGTVYAAFGHTCSPRGIVLPPFGKAHSGAVHDVRLTQGAMAALDIAGLGYLIGSHRLSMLEWGMAAFTVGGKGKGGIPVPISGLRQAGVPTSYNVNLG